MSVKTPFRKALAALAIALIAALAISTLTLRALLYPREADFHKTFLAAAPEIIHVETPGEGWGRVSEGA